MPDAPRAVQRLQILARRHRCLRADVVQHFAILLAILRRHIPGMDVMALVETIVASGRGVLDDEYRYVRFPSDDLLAICRPRGLPIGNLTSQFWSNCVLHPFDQFVARELGCRAYLRYVDDFALFSDSKGERPGRRRSSSGSPPCASSSTRPARRCFP